MALAPRLEGPPNAFSLRATLTLYPELRDAYIPDTSTDGQLHVKPQNFAAIIRKIANKRFDPQKVTSD
jgi:hypothetical protein